MILCFSLAFLALEGGSSLQGLALQSQSQLSLIHHLLRGIALGPLGGPALTLLPEA